MKQYEGKLYGDDLTIGIVVARFNQLITNSLLEGALSGLRRHGVTEENIGVAWVPGGLEIPLVAKEMALSGKYDAIICLGAVIRGATYHFEIVANQSAAGILQAGLATGIPIIQGVLTVESIEQALERAGTKSGNKGYDAAVTAIEMANLMRSLKQ